MMASRDAEHLRAPVLSLVRSVGLATAVPLVIGVVTAPMLARAMDPQDRGHLAGVLAACTITTVVALGGSTQHLPKMLAVRPTEEVWPRVMRQARRLMPGLLLWSVALAAVAAIVWPDSVVQLGLIVAIVITAWSLGMARGMLVGAHQHAGATSSFLFESLVRAGGVVALVLVWHQVGPSLGLLMIGLIPLLVTLAWVTPRMRQLRAVARVPITPSRASDEPTGPSPVRIALAQQFMGRSILAAWAITLAADQIGFIVVAFAMTEVTVNFARIAQPHVIHQAESGHGRAAPWLAAIAVATVASGLAGLLVIAPLFGSEYAAATQIVVPLAIAQGLFAATIVMTGIRFVSDRDAAIRSIQYWMAATVVVTTVIGVGAGAAPVAVAFALMAFGQAASGARWLAGATRHDMAREEAHAA